MSRLALASLLLGLAVAADRPSIVFILTDDQDIELDSLTPMPQLRKVLQGAGATFSHFYVNTPVCCPSRSETLSGRYHHNLRIDSFHSEANGGWCSGDEAVGEEHDCGCMNINNTALADALRFQSATYAAHLQRASYTTGYFGKFLNPPAMEVFCNGGPNRCTGHNCTDPMKHGQPPSYDPSGPRIQGWDEMQAMCITAYYNVPWVTQKGTVEYTGSQPGNYTTSLIGNWTVDFISRHAAAARSGSPFFIAAATRAPHGPQTPAPWYADALPEARNLVDRPDFNFTSSASCKAEAGCGHAGYIEDEPPITAAEAKTFDKEFGDRWRTLLSVDDLVGAVVATLEKEKLLEQTYIFYSSDHGFHLGHLRLGFGKSHFYEFDSRVPFLVRGPGITAGSTIAAPSGNVDLAPTFIELAGGTVPPTMDGKSMVPILHKRTAPRNDFLIEYTGLSAWPHGPKPWDSHSKASKRVNDSPNNTFRGLRIFADDFGLGTSDLAFVQYTTSEDWNYETPYHHELYDMEKDKYQLTNLYHTTPANKLEKLQARLESQWKCKGAGGC